MRPRPVPLGKALLWALLAVPAVHILLRWFTEELWPDELVAPTGEWAARMIIVALSLTPLAMLLPRARPVAWLLARRRAFGVAAFGYAMLHLYFYVREMETLANILAEVPLFGIWTGWAAFALMLPLALTSNDAAVRRLRSGWKKLQRLVYPMALLTLLHWVVVHDALVSALVQVAPLILLESYRLVRLVRPAGRSRAVQPPA
jgi:sulfoxide reductase heme-binding subunit YedZ